MRLLNEMSSFFWVRFLPRAIILQISNKPSFLEGSQLEKGKKGKKDSRGSEPRTREDEGEGGTYNSFFVATQFLREGILVVCC